MMTARTLTPRWHLAPLLADIMTLAPEQNVPLSGIAIDSREVRAGDLFIAVSGSRDDGARFIEQAVSRGAVAVLWEAPGAAQGMALSRAGAAGVAVPLIAVPGLRQRVGAICGRFYHDPSRELTMIGVTGTNGKSSVASYVAQGLQREHNCGLIGTLGIGFWRQLTPSANTTPGPLLLQQTLRRFLDEGARYAVMEVSSHALDQGRINGTDINIGVFTNLSHDHLDYHGDMVAYGKAKKLLFGVPSVTHAVINVDDEFGRELTRGLRADIKILSYGLHAPSGDLQPQIYAHAIELHAAGVRYELCSPWGQCRIESPLLGRFNIANALATFGVFMALDMKFDDAVSRVRALVPVAGRMETFAADNGVTAVVDYAHTPDALAHVLAAIRVHCPGRLICVFGCGGDRDRAKRPLMGSVAEQGADLVVVTDDNPRGEAPAEITRHILSGMAHPDKATVLEDRRSAITYAIAQARRGDVVVVAGKGHEDYQIIGARTIEFSDRDVVRQCLGMTSSATGDVE